MALVMVYDGDSDGDNDGVAEGLVTFYLLKDRSYV